MSAALSVQPQEAPLLPTKLRNARALWVVLVIMALLAGCALLFARGSMRLSTDWQSQLSDTLTVQLILENANDWAAQTSTASTALANALPGADIEVVNQRAARDLLRPWLGNTVLPDNLPVPALINITGKDLSAARVRATLDDIGLTSNIDDNSRYADQLRGTVRRLVAIGIGTLSLVLLAGLCVNIFATRASMTAQKEIIRVLVQVGASDKFIAKLFIGQAFRRGAIGAAIGLGLAGLLWLLLSIMGDWGGLGWSGFGAGLKDLLWLIGLGAVFAVICAGAAGLTATRQLAFERKRL
jgi:cell division transport system permease protein